jgi:hypothetical protein
MTENPDKTDKTEKTDGTEMIDRSPRVEIPGVMGRIPSVF